MWSLHGIRKWKWIQMLYVTWSRWPPCPYMLKTFENLLPWKQKADDFETWYAALVTRVLPNLFKWWLRVDLDLFYSKVKFGPFCFCIGKCLSCKYPRNCWNLWGEYRWTYSQINEYMMILDSSRSGSFTDLCPRSLSFNIFKLLFLKKKNTRPFEAKFHMKPPCDVGMKMCPNIPGPYMVNTFKHHLQNQDADDLETWYKHWVCKYNQICSNYDTGLTLNISYDMVKFASAGVKTYTAYGHVFPSLF